MWVRDAGGTLPLYKQIVKLIEDNIASGRLSPGERLPAERHLAQYLDANRTTVVHALAELEARGVLLRRRGSGTYVNSHKWGVQRYPLVNWQGPPSLTMGAPPAKKEAALQRAAERIRHAREEAARRGELFFDLSGDDLAPDLLPRVTPREGLWEEALCAEQGSSAARLGLESFRSAVRRFLREASGLTAPLEEILITSGSRQALFLITQCLLRPGDAVGVEAPSYCYSLPLFQAAGLRLFALPMDEAGVTLQGLEDVARRRSLKMIFLNPVFHNPTGGVMHDERKKAVLAFCAGARLPVVEDDAYGLLSFGETRDLAPMKSFDRHDQVLYLGSLSSYAGRGIRAGWMVAPPGVIRKLADARLMMDAGLGVLPQVLAREYLERVAAAHLPQLRATLALRARGLVKRLRDILGDVSGDRLELAEPPGGLYCYAALRGASACDAAPLADAREEFLRHGILPAPGEAFGDAPGRFRLNHSLFVRCEGALPPHTPPTGDF